MYMPKCKLSHIPTRLVITTFIILILKISLYAQEEECAFVLREAQDLYNQGLIEDIPGMLQSCIQKGFTKEERLEAYKLIILCHLFDDDQVKADEEMFRFLRRYPEYEISPTDPVEFTYLYNSYNTKHKFTYGVFFGGSLTHGISIEPYSVFNLRNAEPKYKFIPMGITGGARINFLLARNLELCLEGAFSNNVFTYEPDNWPTYGLLANDKETVNRIDVPVSVTYDFPLQKLRFFLRGGFQAGYLISVTRDLNRDYRQEITDIALNEVTGPALDLKPLRNDLNFWAVVGGGLKYKISRGYVIFDVRYNIGLMNYFDESQSRYTATQEAHDLSFLYWNTPGDVRLNSLVFNIGYLRSFYKPKKK